MRWCRVLGRRLSTRVSSPFPSFLLGRLLMGMGVCRPEMLGAFEVVCVRVDLDQRRVQGPVVG